MLTRDRGERLPFAPVNFHSGSRRGFAPYGIPASDSQLEGGPSVVSRPVLPEQ
jgi:hypothetical protein